MQIIATCKVKQNELHKTVSGSDTVAHTSCYCNFISENRNNELRERKSENRNNELRKRKSKHPDSDIIKRLLKSQCNDYFQARLHVHGETV